MSEHSGDRPDPDPSLVDKVHDIVALYMNLRERPGWDPPGAGLLPHTPGRHTHDYVRHGTIDLFAALNLANGVVIHQLTARHRAARRGARADVAQVASHRQAILSLRLGLVISFEGLLSTSVRPSLGTHHTPAPGFVYATSAWPRLRLGGGDHLDRSHRHSA